MSKLTEGNPSTSTFLINILIIYQCFNIPNLLTCLLIDKQPCIVCFSFLCPDSDELASVHLPSVAFPED